MFVAKYDASGGHLWSQGFGDTLQQWGRSVAVDPSDNVILAGWFHGTLDFGGGPLTSVDLEDVFLARFSTR